MQPVKALNLLIMIMATAGLGATACAVAAEDMPRPRLRPAEATAPATPTAAIPVPHLRPALKATAQPDLPEAPAPEPGPKPAGGWPAEVVAAGRAECQTLLTGLDLAYTPVEPIGEQGGCGAPAPIEVTMVAGVRLVPPATQSCAMAAALAAWVADGVKPAAKRRLGTEVTEIRTATSYACRRRNNGSSGKMSEHSKANALDMSGFTFAKSTDVAVGGKDNWGEGLLGAMGLSKGGSFLEDIRAAACTHFTTVLGPGSDPFHGDHFHVDVLQRKGGYRICQ
jgi:hypothetical protein